MRRRAFALAAVVAALLVLAAVPLMADEEAERPGYGMGYGMRPGMMGMGYGTCYDPGCSMGMGCGHGPAWEEYLEFLDKTKKLRKELHMKMFDYNEALMDPEIKDRELEKILSEMRKLRRKIEVLYMKMLMSEREEMKK